MGIERRNAIRKEIHSKLYDFVQWVRTDGYDMDCLGDDIGDKLDNLLDALISDVKSDPTLTDDKKF